MGYQRTKKGMGGEVQAKSRFTENKTLHVNSN